MVNNTYWISFAGNKGNLGCCIIDATNERLALNKTISLGINPGGEAMFFEIPNDPNICEDLKWGKNVLITPQQLAEDSYTKTKDIDPFELERIKQAANSITISEKENRPLND